MPRTGSVLLNETDVTGPWIRYSQIKKSVCERENTEAELWFEGSLFKKMCGQSVFTCNATSLFSSAFLACLFGSSRLRSPW